MIDYNVADAQGALKAGAPGSSSLNLRGFCDITSSIRGQDASPNYELPHLDGTDLCSTFLLWGPQPLERKSSPEWINPGSAPRFSLSTNHP